MRRKKIDPGAVLASAEDGIQIAGERYDNPDTIATNPAPATRGASQQSWRDDVKVHPAADLFPMMSDAELDELASDIAEHGLQQPIVWLGNALLDGRNRVAALHRIPDSKRREEIGRQLRQGKHSIIMMMHPDPAGYVISANRRHLTPEQRRNLIATLLKAKPERSDRATAKIAKTDHKTVAAVRTELASSPSPSKGEIPHKPAERIEASGRRARGQKPRQQPAHKPAPAPVHSARDKAITGFSTILHQQLAKTLEDVGHILGGERGRIVEMIPLSKRVIIARGYLQALGVSLDDLRPIDDDDESPSHAIARA